MRTILVELIVRQAVDSEFRISTEVIVEDGEEQAAGREAKTAIDRFIQGYGEAE